MQAARVLRAPTLTGMWKISSARSTAPSIFECRQSVQRQRNQLFVAGASQLRLNEREQFVVARLHDFRERLSGEISGGRSPTLGTLIVSSGPASWVSAQA